MTEPKIDWMKYFDRIWCVNFIPYRDRHDAIAEEFDRVGISDHPNFTWNYTFDSPLYDIAFRFAKTNYRTFILSNVTQLKCWAGHYGCIKRSLAFGDERVLILEDDSRFLKDVSTIGGILDDLPSGYDVTLLDHFVNVPKETYEGYRAKRINDHFSEYEDLDSCGCYALSRKGLERLAYAYETVLSTPDAYTSKMQIDGIRKAFSLTNVTCQAVYRKSMNVMNGSVDGMHGVYRRSNINYSLYNMNGGGDYGYGTALGG